MPSFEENKLHKREASRWAKQLKKKNRDDAANRTQANSLRGYCIHKTKAACYEKKMDKQRIKKFLEWKIHWLKSAIPHLPPSHEISQIECLLFLWTFHTRLWPLYHIILAAFSACFLSHSSLLFIIHLADLSSGVLESLEGSSDLLMGLQYPVLAPLCTDHNVWWLTS